MFSCRSLARLMLRVKNPPEEGVKYVRLASPSANANHMHGFHLAVVVCVISNAHEIGILVPFTWCFYSAVTLANSTPLSKIAHDRYGFQFLASLNVSPSGSPLEKKQKKPKPKQTKKKSSSILSFQVLQNVFFQRRPARLNLDAHVPWPSADEGHILSSVPIIIAKIRMYTWDSDSTHSIWWAEYLRVEAAKISQWFKRRTDQTEMAAVKAGDRVTQAV